MNVAGYQQDAGSANVRRNLFRLCIPLVRQQRHSFRVEVCNDTGVNVTTSVDRVKERNMQSVSAKLPSNNAMQQAAGKALNAAHSESSMPYQVATIAAAVLLVVTVAVLW